VDGTLFEACASQKSFRPTDVSGKDARRRIEFVRSIAQPLCSLCHLTDPHALGLGNEAQNLADALAGATARCSLVVPQAQPSQTFAVGHFARLVRLPLQARVRVAARFARL